MQFGDEVLYDAMRRGLDYTRSPGTFTVWPFPQVIGSFQTFAPLTNEMILHNANLNPAPNMLTNPGVFGGVGQFDILPKQTS